MWVFSRGEWGPFFLVVLGLLIAAASCCGAEALGRWSVIVASGLVVPRYMGSSLTRDQTHVPCIGKQILTHCARLHAKSLQSCLTPCDPMDCSLPDSSVLGILQARMLEGFAMPSSRGSS